MRVGFLSLALIVVAFAGAPGNPASATRTAFAQSQQPRNQAQSQEDFRPIRRRRFPASAPKTCSECLRKIPQPAAGQADAQAAAHASCPVAASAEAARDVRRSALRAASHVASSIFFAGTKSDSSRRSP